MKWKVITICTSLQEKTFGNDWEIRDLYANCFQKISRQAGQAGIGERQKPIFQCRIHQPTRHESRYPYRRRPRRNPGSLLLGIISQQTNQSDRKQPPRRRTQQRRKRDTLHLDGPERRLLPGLRISLRFHPGRQKPVKGIHPARPDSSAQQLRSFYLLKSLKFQKGWMLNLVH